MKKVILSLLMVAATLNAFAITYTGKAQLTLKSLSNNKTCILNLAESEDFHAGLNDGRYAELNEEGKEVFFYVVYEGVRYSTFASNAETMKDLQLGIKTNESATYRLTAANVTGTLKLRINGVEYTVAAGMSEDITLPASSTLPAAGDEINYKVQPSAIVEGIVFNYDKLELTKYKGAKVQIFAESDPATPTKSVEIASDAKTEIDLSDKNPGRYVVKVDRDNDGTVADEDVYQIDVKVKEIPDSKYKEL